MGEGNGGKGVRKKRGSGEVGLGDGGVNVSRDAAGRETGDETSEQGEGKRGRRNGLGFAYVSILGRLQDSGRGSTRASADWQTNGGGIYGRRVQETPVATIAINTMPADYAGSNARSMG